MRALKDRHHLGGGSAEGAAQAEQEDATPPGHSLNFFFLVFFWFFWFFFLVFFGKKKNSKSTMFHCGPFSKKKKNTLGKMSFVSARHSRPQIFPKKSGVAPLHFFSEKFAVDTKSDPVSRCAP